MSRNIIVDTVKLFDEDQEVTKKPISIMVEMDGFMFESDECDSLKEFFEQIANYEREV